MHAQCLWTFNKEISEVQRKATAVPALMYANAVLASTNSKTLTAYLDKTQMAAGRWALGITTYRVANEFIIGELGWSSFEAREAQSKIRHLARIGSMRPDRWPKMVLFMMANVHVYTEAVKRLKHLRIKYRCGSVPLICTEDGKPRLSKFYKDVKDKVRETQDRLWREGTTRKPSLDLYSKYKKFAV